MANILHAIEHVDGDHYLFMGKFNATGSNPTEAIVNILLEHAEYDGMTGKVHKLVRQGLPAAEVKNQDRMQLRFDDWYKTFKADFAKGEQWTRDSVQTKLSMTNHMGEDYEAFMAFRNAQKEGLLYRKVRGDQFKIHRPPMSQSGYHQILGVTLPISHWVWLLVYRALPPDKITNVDGNKLNNRIENLKVAVKKRSLPHQCVVLHNGKQHHLGRFATPAEVDAARAEFHRKQAVTS